MRIFVTGATGFVGSALCPRLERDGHRVVAFVRSAARARGRLAPSVELLEAGHDAQGADPGMERELARCDAVVHLAGEPVFPRRWTPARKQEIGRASWRERVGI